MLPNKYILTQRHNLKTLIVEPMPRKPNASRSSDPEVLRLTQVVMNHHITIDKCSARVRHLPNMSQLYDDAVERYTNNPMYRLAAGDEQVRKEFYASVDEICKTDPSTPEEYVFCTPSINGCTDNKPVKAASRSYSPRRLPFRSC